MNIYKISRTDVCGYDAYDSFVCIAESEDEALEMHPSSYVKFFKDGNWFGVYSGGDKVGQPYRNNSDCWVSPMNLNTLDVELIGRTNLKKRVVLSSFNAG